MPKYSLNTLLPFELQIFRVCKMSMANLSMGRTCKFPLVIMSLKFNLLRILSSVLILIIKISTQILVTNGDLGTIPIEQLSIVE